MDDPPKLPESSRSETDETWAVDSPATPSGGLSFAPGTVLAGRYRVDAYLAAGGMGQVYSAHDLALDVRLALKTIRPEIAANPSALRLFKQEVLLARAVSHPNVCRIFDLGQDEPTGVTFLTMEFLPGGTLSSRIGTKGALTVGESLPLAHQMAEALDAAHRAGIVHRDFKSPNVMVVPNGNGGRAVITDFGLAAPLEPWPGRDRTQPNAATDATTAVADDIVGTPAYMSPEQVRGGPVGPASDLYALGVVLFEMRTGKVPFREATPLQTAQAHLTMNPPSPRTLAQIEDTWERTILRLLSKQPEERYASARDAVLALEDRLPEGGATQYLLPPEQDVFVGRAEELEALTSRFGNGARLLTLQGPGGTGKTRLVTRYGWQTLGRWPGGVWFCDLSETRSLGGIVATVAKSLNVPPSQDDPVVRLGHAIAGRGKCLLILDNFEQVVDHAEATLGRWLERATDASFLVTSRERLRLGQEETLELEPLDPGTQGAELFEVRARGHRPGFVLDDSNRETVKAIVKSLDGLPLAIELAAARLRMLSVEQLRDRLKDRFRILGGGKGRHSTLRSTLDWSWDLLQPWEQSAVAQISVFEGGFTLEAAEAVIDISSFKEDLFVLDVIQALVDKSWLRAKVALGVPRFDMYATIQEYALGKLENERRGASPDSAAGTGAGECAGAGSGSDAGLGAEARHGAFFAELGTGEAIEGLQRHEGVEKVAALRLELDNLIAACRRSVARGDENTAAGCYVAADVVLQLQGPLTLSVGLGSEALKGITDPVLRGRALPSLSHAERLAGRTEEARIHAEEALALAREAGDRKSEGIALGNLGTVLLEKGQMEEARRLYEAALTIHRENRLRRLEGVTVGQLAGLFTKQGRLDEALAHYETALAVAREMGSRQSEGNMHGHLGTVQTLRGRMEKSRVHFEEALTIHREVGNRLWEGLALGNLGILHVNQGRLDEAGSCFESARSISREIGDRPWEGIVLSNLGGLEHARGRREEARTYYQDALGIHREAGNRRSEGIVLGNLGIILFEEGRIREAREHCEGALAIHREVGNRSFEGTALVDLGKIQAGEHADDARRCFQDGLAILRDLGDDVEVLSALCALGKFEARLDRLESARTALAEAESIAAKLEVTPESHEARAIEELRSGLENHGGGQAEPDESR